MAAVYYVMRGVCPQCGVSAHATMPEPPRDIIDHPMSYARPRLQEAFSRMECPRCHVPPGFGGIIVKMTEAEYNTWNMIR
jgi:rRNA maturation protein Nop10